jgi:hypothetical protein
MADLTTLEASARRLAQQMERVGKHIESITPGNRSHGSIDAALDAMADFRRMTDQFIGQATLCAVNRRNMPVPEAQPAPDGACSRSGTDT